MRLVVFFCDWIENVLHFHLIVSVCYFAKYRVVMVITGLSYDGPNFSRCSYSSVNFEDEKECRRCGRCRDNCRLLLRITILTLKVVIVINLLIFVVIPLIFKFSYALQRKAVFLNFVNLPENNDYSQPKVFGLEGARNFYLYNNGVKLGVWQILPSQIIPNKTDDNTFETYLGNGQDVILYNHGNAGSRATAHRVEMYKFLSNFFHVITYDYRGYGDSGDDPPSEADVVSDCKFMVQWIRSKVSSESHIFIWGHSLGTSIALSATSTLKKEGFVPTGIILEAPFNNFRDEIGEFPLALLFKYLPWFDACIVNPLTENGFVFQSDEYILNADCPILIMHAEDDRTVPFELGKKLYTVASEKRLETQGSVQFQSFPKKFHYGHRYIIRAPELHDIVERFIRKAVNETEMILLGEKN